MSPWTVSASLLPSNQPSLLSLNGGAICEIFDSEWEAHAIAPHEYEKVNSGRQGQLIGRLHVVSSGPEWAHVGPLGPAPTLMPWQPVDLRRLSGEAWMRHDRGNFQDRRGTA